MKYMNSLGFSSRISDEGEKQVFSLIDRVGRCVGKIFFQKKQGRKGMIYEVPLLGTSNGGPQLDELNISGIEKLQEKIPGLLYIMFQLFIRYLKSIEYEEFSINIQNPLLTLTNVYRKLFVALSQQQLIESGVVQPQLVVLKC